VNGRRVPLGRRALDILSVLAEARGAIVTKDELLESVWPGVTVEENALQVHIVALRKALGPEADRLKTIRGVGYQLDVDGEVPAPPVPPGVHARDLAETPVDRTLPVAPARTTSSAMRRFRPALVVAALLVALFGAWWMAGPLLGLRSHDRIPVVVRALEASGSGEPTERTLANGITDELIDRLRRIPELRIATVRSGGSVPQQSFENAYVVDGSIRRSGERLRVMIRLSDAGGEILWSQTFDRRLVELLDMQQRTAVAIADALSVSLDVGVDATAYGGTDNPEAYAAYLEYTANAFNPDQTVPMRHIERALELDPDYIRALAARSIGYQIMINATPGLTRQQTLALQAKADQSSARALAANPNLWIGPHARGWYHMMARHDFRAAEMSWRRMAELDRGDDPEVRAAVAGIEDLLGRRTKAFAIYESGKLIDPVVPTEVDKVEELFVRSRFQDVIDLGQKAGADDPASQLNLSRPVFWSYLALGREEDAIRYSEQYAPFWAEGLRAFRAEKGLPAMSPAELRRWADRRFGDGGQILVSGNALFAAYDGHPQLAIELMRVGFEKTGGGFIGFFWFPAMAEARKTDAFEKLVTDIGLVDVWRESGDWGDYCRPVSATEISCR
jgi:DNA-binding winged helix-turn-helix (wHTH) protein/TolB-like protein